MQVSHFLRSFSLRATPAAFVIGALAGGLLATGIVGCDDASDPAGTYTVPEGCSPLAADWHCSLPFPSDVFRSESGEIVMEGEAGAVREDGTHVNLYAYGQEDGFSPGTQILAYFPLAIDASNLNGIFDNAVFGPEGDWETRTGPTLIIDAENGERVPHYAELDTHAVSLQKQTLILRPLVRLENGHRYIVAISGLKDTDGNAVPAAEGFRRLRDDAPAGGASSLEDLRTHFETAVFPVLADVDGLERGNLQLAWDFTVRSATTRPVTATMEAIRSQMATTLEAAPPVVTITDVTDFEEGDLLKRIEGTIAVPLYLESAEPGARLRTDDPAAPEADGTADVPFVAIVPRSVLDGETVVPARVVQYGHGIFGSRKEISEEGSWIPAFANEYNFVVMAVDWWGMSGSDVTAIVSDLGNRPQETMAFTDRVHQAMANQLALAEAMTRVLPELDEFKVGDAAVYDPESLYFIGNSLGHIFGSTYLSMSSRIERAALGVGAANFSHFLARSASFGQFFLALEAALVSPMDLQLFFAMTQSGFDRVDPISYAPSVYDPFDGGAPKKILVQMGLGDATVPNLGTAYYARLYGLPVLENSPGEIPLLDTVAAPTADSAIAIYDFGIDPLPGVLPEPPERNGVHDGPRKAAKAQAQIDAFLQPDGEIDWFCDAPCTLELPEED
jgi:hypothetical protein